MPRGEFLRILDVEVRFIFGAQVLAPGGLRTPSCLRSWLCWMGAIYIVPSKKAKRSMARTA